MNQDTFVSNVPHGDIVLKKIKEHCVVQGLILDRILYDYYSLFLATKNKTEIKVILVDISHYNPRNNLVISREVANHRARIKKEITPMEIEEGEIMCYKCKGKKVLRTQAQTSSADESTTTYLRCVNPEKPFCRNKWRVR